MDFDFVVQTPLSGTHIRPHHPPAFLVCSDQRVGSKMHPSIRVLKTESCVMRSWRCKSIVLLVSKQWIRNRTRISIPSLILSEVERLVELSLSIWHSQDIRFVRAHHIVPGGLVVLRSRSPRYYSAVETGMRCGRVLCVCRARWVRHCH